MTARRLEDPALLAGRIAEIRAEVLAFSTQPESNEILEELLAAVASLERVIDRIARRAEAVTPSSA
jgi:hypothetical protein